MALTAVETGIMGMMDRLAWYKSACAFLGIGGTRMWARSDATGDETFENRMGQAASTLDDALGTETTAGDLPLGQITDVRTFLDTLSAYAKTDAGYGSFDAYLTAKGWRIPQQAAEIWKDRFGTASLTAANIGGPADAGAAAPGLVLGDLTRGGALVAGTDMSATACGGAPILARVTAIGSSDWTLSVTMKLWDATTKVVSQVVSGTGATPAGAAGDTYIIGAQAIGGATNAGQKVVTCAATAQFKVGQKVLLTEWTGSAPDEAWTSQEVALIASIQENTSITVTTNLLHAYTAAGFIYPFGFGVSAASGTGGTASDRVYFYPAADRRLKL